MISDGADVVWHVLDAADAGVLSAAEDEGVMAIGLYGDQSELAPNAHIGAIIADASELVYAAGSQALDGQVHDEGIAAGVVSIGHYSDAVPQEVQDQIAAIEEESEERTGGDAGVISPGRRSREVDDGFRECRAPREVCGARQRSLSPRARDRGRGREWYRLG